MVSKHAHKRLYSRRVSMEVDVSRRKWVSPPWKCFRILLPAQAKARRIWIIIRHMHRIPNKHKHVPSAGDMAST